MAPLALLLEVLTAAFVPVMTPEEAEEGDQLTLKLFSGTPAALLSDELFCLMPPTSTSRAAAGAVVPTPVFPEDGKVFAACAAGIPTKAQNTPPKIQFRPEPCFAIPFRCFIFFSSNLRIFKLSQ